MRSTCRSVRGAVSHAGATRKRVAHNRCRTRAAPTPSSDVDAEDNALVVEAQRVLQLLETRREMTLPEVRLVLMVEDPRAAQRRRQYGLEEDSGCSREDVVEALSAVAAGRVPSDGLALRQLVKELQAWPYLESDVAVFGAGEKRTATAAVQDAPEGEKDLSSYLPKWVGFSAVYLISAIPVFITLAVVTLLFVTSLK